MTTRNAQGLFGGAPGLERLPLLRTALERTGAACAEDVRAALSVPLRLALHQIESATGEDVLAKAQGRGAIALLKAVEWGAQLIACADSASVLALVEAILGGDGAQPAPAVERPLTGIEIDLAGLFFGALGRALGAAFEPIAASSFAVEAATGADAFEAAWPKDAVVASYRLEVLERNGKLTIAIPRSAIEALRKPLSQGLEKARRQPDPRWAEQMRRELTRTNVVLTAILDQRALPLADVLNLQVGHIIPLEATPHSRVRVECNGEHLLWCELGKSNGVYTLRVESITEREQEVIETMAV
jgi:flagellar motor switch protein FliM